MTPSRPDSPEAARLRELFASHSRQVFGYVLRRVSVGDGTDVAVAQDGPTLHIHAVLGRSDGSTVGGHLLEDRVRPTLEITVIEPPAHLRKRKDPETGLALIDLGRS